MNRNVSLIQVKQVLLHSYFSNGFADSNIKLLKYDYFVGKYEYDEHLPVMEDGKPFTFEAYRGSLTTSPVRIYLYTKAKVKLHGSQSTHIFHCSSSQVTF